MNRRILCLRVGRVDSGHGSVVSERKSGQSGHPSSALPAVHGSLSTGHSPPTIDDLAQWCERFSPLVGLESSSLPESLLLDITSPAHLFGGEAAMARRILQELAVERLAARAAVADTIGAAWAVAHFGVSDSEVRVVPSGETLAALRPLPIEALRLPEDTVELLHQLGVWRIEQFQRLPRGGLSSRFGPRLIRRWDQAVGRMAEALPPYEPPSRFEARWSPEYPAARQETIEAALEHLIERIAEKLAREGRGAMQLHCRLDCAAGDAIEISVGLFQATAAAKHLFGLVQVQFERTRLPGPVTAIHIAATSTAPFQRRQEELFADGAPRRHPRHLSGLVERLSNRLGRESVVRVRLAAEAQPELAWKSRPMVGSVRRSPASVADDLPPRPLRLLAAPVPVKRGQGAGGKGQDSEWLDPQQRIARVWGPERIETGWWRGRAVGRDYYRVETTTGRRFWLFRRLRDGQWFLHGMFD